MTVTSVRLPAPTTPDATAVAAFTQARGVPPFGPFVPLLYAPALLPRAEALGRAVRYEGKLPDAVREIAILTTAHAWNQRVEWTIHAPVALAAGCSQASLDAIAAGFAPDEPVQATAWRVAQALHRTRDLDDANYADGLAVFGPEQLIELVVLCGYYAMLAMVMNTARTAHD